MPPFCIHRLSWHSAIVTLVTLLVLYPSWSHAGPPFPEFVDPNPHTGSKFGATVVALSNGNVAITAPNDDAGGTDAGAVYLFNGATGALISSLRGSLYNSYVGSGGVTALPNGNFLVHSPSWRDGVYVGAVTFVNGVTGLNGVVSSSNSLVGRSGDGVGVNDAINSVAILSNGNYVVCSPSWRNGSAWSAGAVTWGSGTSGVSGEISSSNSLVGTTANDQVGKALAATPSSPEKSCVTPLSNGNYVVNSRFWDHAGAVDAGAVTWGSGTSGVQGAISSSNSLVGSSAGDQVGNLSAYDTGNCVMTLGNGNYVVVSPLWDNAEVVNAGAVTWGSGTSGTSGVISGSNSLVGTTAEDSVGRILRAIDAVTSVQTNGVTVLTNGNYVVASPNWDHGALVDGGAVTWGDGMIGFSGMISSTNSLVGIKQGDQLGSGGVTALANGHYVTSSPLWDNGTVVDAGAVTWGNGTTGITGSPTEFNSLVGTQANDGAGSGGVAALTNGNYVVLSPNWSYAGWRFAGAATWCDGITGRSGIISRLNSLVGTKKDDQIGKGGVMALRNGNYLVKSPEYANDGKYYAGAVTWGSGTSGVKDAVSSGNSLVGGHSSDWVGSTPIIELTNGNYVVASPYWHSGDKAWAGAATLCSGTAGLSGVVSSSNSLVGSNLSDRVGHHVTALSNGNYVVSSPYWNNGQVQDAGAVTWGNGTTGVKGIVSSGNSLVGTTAEDSVGPVMDLGNGNYVVTSGHWNNGSALYAGAVTWGSGTSGVKGPVSSSNSLVGSSELTYLGHHVTKMGNGNFVVQSCFQDGPGVSAVWAVTWGRGTSGVSGAVSGSNSLLGLTGSDSEVAKVVTDEVNRTYFALFPKEGKVRVGSQVDGLDPSTPDIAVAGAGPLTDGVGSINFGTTAIGESTQLTLTITNPGTAEIAGLAVSKEGTNADDFSLSALSDTSIPAGKGSVFLTVTFSPSSIGVRTAVIRIASNVDGTKNPFDITVTGTGVSSDSNLSGLSVNGVTLTPTFAADTVIYTGSVPNTTTSLTISPVTSHALASVLVRVNGGGYALPSSPLTLIVGTNTVEVLVTAQDGTSTKSYNLMVTRAAASEIAISGNNVEIAHGDSTPSVPDGTDFGSVAVASGMSTHLFTLANTGTSALNLTGAPAVTITGPHATDFHVSLLPDSPVAVSSSTTFQVAFAPSVVGLRTAVVSIDSDDADENPHTFAIAGTGRVASQAAQTLVFTPPAKLHLIESPVTLSGDSSSGLPVTYTVISGPAIVSGNVLALTGTGTVKVRASQPGNEDFLAAAPVERMITVAANPATLTLTNLSQTYTGTPRPITVLGATGEVNVTYQVGSLTTAAPPINAGSYRVKAVAGAVTKTGTLVIAKAPLYVTPDDQRKFAGKVNPALTSVYSGFKGSDTADTAVTKAPTLTTTATSRSPGGRYPITARGAVAANYAFVYRQGTLVVESFGGRYEALLVDGAELPVGKLTLTVPLAGQTFTGKLYTAEESASVPLAGSLVTDADNERATGRAAVTVKTIPYVIDVTLPLHGDVLSTVTRKGLLLGSANDGRKLLSLPARGKVHYAGPHTVVLEPATPGGPAVPAGAGWATATISTTGLITLTGCLGDGTAFTSALSPDGNSDPGYRLFVQPYLPARTQSYLGGQFRLKAHPNVLLPGRRYLEAANMTWTKSGKVTDASYRGSFGPVTTILTLDPWQPPTASRPLATLLGLSGSNLGITHSSTGSVAHDPDLPTSAALSANSVIRVLLPAANKAKWKTTLVPATGRFSGSFELIEGAPPIKRIVPFTGVLRQPPVTPVVPGTVIGDGNYLLPPLIGTEKVSGDVSFTRP